MRTWIIASLQVCTWVLAPSLLHLARCRPLHLGLCAVIGLFENTLCHRNITHFLILGIAPHISHTWSSQGDQCSEVGAFSSHKCFLAQVSHCCATTFEFCKPLRCKSLLYHLVQSYSDFLYLDLLGKGGASLLQQTMPSPTWRHNHFEDSSVLAHGIAHAIANVHGDLGGK